MVCPNEVQRRILCHDNGAALLEGVQEQAKDRTPKEPWEMNRSQYVRKEGTGHVERPKR